jgi:uncharacterized protein with HEPN domain
MKKNTFLSHHIICNDIHTFRLQTSLEEIKHLIPFTEASIKNLSKEESAYVEVIYSRFGKLQDTIGNKIFSAILTITGETPLTFIDKLNTLEKLRYLDDAAWWLKIRDLRNQITHDYEDDYETIAEHTNTLIEQSHKLLAYWDYLKPRLTTLMAQAENQ